MSVLDFNPQIRRSLLSLSIAVVMALGASGASLSMAATTKPTPKPSAKTTVKATPKPTVKTTAKATKKPVAKKKATKKPVAKKKTTKKKVLYKKKITKVKPSPPPTWPPKGFRVNGEVYAKVPTPKELLGVISAASTLASQVKDCSKYACGAVQVASSSGCTWWEITSTVSGPSSETDPTIIPYGSLRTTAKASRVKQVVTILLISTEPLRPNISVGDINITCYHSPRTEKVPTSTYTSNMLNTPAPTATPNTPTPTATPTPTN
ncbi:MAG: hypothetical protein AABY37_01185 [Actinomycetota bacterium]